MAGRIAGTSAAAALMSVAIVWGVSGPAAAQDSGLPVVRTAGSPAVTEDGFAIDAASYAAAQGIGLEQARTALVTQRSVSDTLGRLQAAFPDSYAGGWVRHSPQVHGVAWFVGTVPSRAYEVVGTDPVTLRGGADVTLVELQHRSTVVHTDLVAQDRPQVTTSHDVTSGTVEATVKLRPEEVGLPRETLLAGLPPSARQPGVVVEFVNGEMTADEHTRGGAKTPGDAGGYCTTGFAVSKDGVDGFVTAGHCDNARDYLEPEVGGVQYDAPWQATHRGQWGDFQWHTTSHVEYAEFYSSSTGFRPVQGYDGVISVGEYVCKHGRTTGYGCSYIYRVDISATVSGYSYDRLVAVEDFITDSGDSGGPWFLVYNAVGVHKGYTTIWFKKRSYFSPIFYMDDALGLALRVQ